VLTSRRYRRYWSLLPESVSLYWQPCWKRNLLPPLPQVFDD